MRTKNELDEDVLMPIMKMFIGYYRIPKGAAIYLDTISVSHVLPNGMLGEECDFEIKNKNGEWIIVPDVYNIDLQHSMQFFISMKQRRRIVGKITFKTQ